MIDGAGAILLMSEEKARSLGYQPLGFIRSYAYAALDPGEQLHRHDLAVRRHLAEVEPEGLVPALERAMVESRRAAYDSLRELAPAS